MNEINTDPAGIQVENNVDLEGPPENFKYINDYMPGEGLTIPQDPIIGCECENCLDVSLGVRSKEGIQGRARLHDLLMQRNESHIKHQCATMYMSGSQAKWTTQ